MNHVTFVFKEGEEYLVTLGHLRKPFIATCSCTGKLKLATSDTPRLDDVPFFPLFGWFEGMDVTVYVKDNKVRFYTSSKSTNMYDIAKKMITVIFPDLAKLKYNNDFEVVDNVEGYDMKNLSSDLIEKLRLANIDKIAKAGSNYYMEFFEKKIATLNLIREDKTRLGYYKHLIDENRKSMKQI